MLLAMKIFTEIKPHIALGTIKNNQVETIRLLITNTASFKNDADLETARLIYAEAILAGTKKLSREDIQQSLKKLGSSFDVSAGNGRVFISVKCLAKKAKATLQLLLTILDDADFKVTEQKRIKRTLENYLDSEKENAKLIANINFNNSFCRPTNQNYLYLPEILLTALKQHNLAATKSIHQEFINSHWTVTVGGGDAAVEQVISTVTKWKQGKENNLAEKYEHHFQPIKKRSPALAEVPSKQNIELAIGGFVDLTYESQDLPAFIFGIAVLGKWGGFAGRLMSTVREKEGLTYGIYARAEKMSLDQNGYFRIMTFFSPKDVTKGITSTLREVKKLRDKGLTQTELTNFRQILKTEDILAYDSIGKITAQVHGLLSSGINWEEHALFKAKLYSCSKKEIDQALKKYIDLEKMVISAAGPIKNVEKELKKLK